MLDNYYLNCLLEGDSLSCQIVETLSAQQRFLMVLAENSRVNPEGLFLHLQGRTKISSARLGSGDDMTEKSCFQVEGRIVAVVQLQGMV